MSDIDESSTTSNTPRETDEVTRAHPLARFFFLQTTFAVLFTVLLTAGGYFAYTNLVKESLPDLDIPMAMITTAWPGADPQTIESQVTKELEDEIATLKGLKTFSSASFDSFSIIAVEFTADSDSNQAMQRLRTAVSDAEGELPGDAESPSIQQVSVDDRPIMTIALHGAASDAELNKLAKTLQERIETVSGVNEVNLGGSRDEIIQILLDPERLLALGIPPNQVSQAISAANLDQPFGEIESDDIGAVVRLAGQFQSIEDLAQMPVVRLGNTINERLLRLSDIGQVRRQLEKEETRAFFSEAGSPFSQTIEVSIKKAPGADTVKLIEQIKADLSLWHGDNFWPQGVSYKVTQDEAEQIWDSLSNVFMSGLQAMVAVFFILFLILTWREGLVASLSIPLSFFAAMLALWLLDYSLNELVIIGMVLALGLLVDVFILMMEGLHEEIYTNKKTFGQAALATIGKYGMPAFAGQLTTILALAPLIAIAGTAGKFIQVLPVTAIVSLVAAFIVAMLASVPLSRFVLGGVARQGADTQETRTDRAMNNIANRLKTWSLQTTLVSKKRASAMVAGALVLFVLSMLAATRVPLVLFPDNDGLNLGINIELPPSTTLDTSQEVADAVGELLRDKPSFDTVIKLVGSKSPMVGGSISSALNPSDAENFIGFSITLVELGEREKPSYVLAQDIRAELSSYLKANVPGASLLVQAETGGPSTEDPISIAVSGDDMNELQRLSSQIQGMLNRIAGTTDVRDNLGSVKSEITLTPNREATDFYGLSQQDLATQVRFSMANDKIGSFATTGTEDDLDIHLGLSWQSRDGGAGGPTQLAEMSMIRAFTPGGETVPLLSLLDPHVTEAPISVIHKDGKRTITVLSKIDGRNVNEIIAELTPKLDQAQRNWPSGYAWSIGGESEEMAETFGSAGAMLVVALIMVFGVLVIVFGSFSQALILMTTMPLALIGTFLGFWLTGMSLSFFAVIGVVSLIGIVANNGIVMVDTMNRLLRNGAEIAEAAAEGAATRLRPILTTSITTVVGLVPLAIGSPMYAPLCYAIIFGLVASTALSLIIVPCLYLLLTRESQRSATILD
ncbi:efflux RND transporter permease subunit [Marinobacter sp. ATCH36]|uniref:efflux RND transporter permease subunit n=1 Tax=Marinobacter sp. ATCH36 TaxID=2945106 RepID=UPI0020205B5E|nr:efflux RND transporter permease subunit [Marinobacter sp. ATCH36]MCL7944044.1 efflux RND transporter permease subunit [Marinobacter sp. ATCH36]